MSKVLNQNLQWIKGGVFIYTIKTRKLEKWKKIKL